LNYFVPLLIGAGNHILLIFYFINHIINYSFSHLLNTSFHNNILRFNKKNFIHIKNRINNKFFGSYLAGLFEGDGHVLIVKPHIKSSRYTICITFHIKDLPLCEHIKNKIKHGWIRMKIKENACVLTFYTDEGLIAFVKLVNGYLRTPKLYKYNLVLNYLNNKYGLNFFIHEPDYSNLEKNSWLAGFIDADGSFYIECPSEIKFGRCAFRIEQRMIDPFSSKSYEPIILLIAKFFYVNIQITTHNIDKKYYCISVCKKSTIAGFIHYLDRHKLYSSKYLDYLNWTKACTLWIKGEAHLPRNIKLIYNWKHGMNSKRKDFHWTHLSDL
jgi:LAGLIDADG endonuclease